MSLSVKENIIIAIAAICIVLGAVFVLKDYGKRYADAEAKTKIVEEKEIFSCALSKNSSSQSRAGFILGCGGFSESETENIRYYFYMTGEKGLSLQYVDASNAEIVPITEGTPRIEGHFEDGKIIRKFTFSDFEEEMTKYYLYLPNDYIVEEYDIDLSQIK